MPIYEYQCDCTEGIQERLLPRQECNRPQVCACGKVMLRKMSVPLPAIFTPTGKGMALDSLNSGVTGGKRKAWAENLSAQGL